MVRGSSENFEDPHFVVYHVIIPTEIDLGGGGFLTEYLSSAGEGIACCYGFKRTRSVFAIYRVSGSSVLRFESPSLTMLLSKR